MNPLRLIALVCCSCVLLAISAPATHAADKTLENFKKAMSGNNAGDKKKAIAAMASGGEDELRLPALIKAINDRQVGKLALEAVERRTGLKPGLRSGTNPGYPGYPTTRDAAGWSKWWSDKQAKEAEEARLKELEERADETDEEIAQAAQDDENGEPDDEQGDGETETKSVKKSSKSDHEKYGKIDRIIFKNGNLLMCYIISKQVDLDGNLTSIDVVHKNGAGQESLDAKMISTFEEDVK